MSDRNSFGGVIAITPPLTWAEIQAGPPLRDLRLRVDQQTTDTPTGQVVALSASAILPPEREWGGEHVGADLRSLVERHGGGHAFSGFIEMQPDPGYGDPAPVRFTVRDGAVCEDKARLVWPDDEPEQMPARVGAAELAGLLREMAQGVEARDSFDGSLAYNMTGRDTDEYDVTGLYRYGNSQGQGFMRVIRDGA